jgi:hypothetical protein
LHFNGQQPWLGVFCSSRYGNAWHVNLNVVGQWGSNGRDHAYCRQPTYNGIRWSLRT